QGQWVWVDTDAEVAVGARVKVTPSGQRLLVDDEGKVNTGVAQRQDVLVADQGTFRTQFDPLTTLLQERSLTQELEASLRVMHPTLAEGVDDMVNLGEMTEAGLLRNLMLRYKQGVIYTYIGSVLVAVNPYQDFPIYTSEQVKLYQGGNLEELPPHIYALAESCYSRMTRHLQNQCCIIRSVPCDGGRNASFLPSGESGAGKTESTKLILRYLAAVSSEMSKRRVERLVLESNPILEAFGNAKTTRNDNSSRFGKYLEIFFNEEGVIEGARMEQYLLEKSRVCHQALGERNYHIFYCMLAGITAEEKKALTLSDPGDYMFLTKGSCIQCEGRDDAAIYKHVRSAMELFFSESQCQEIFRLLAAILHLGNICFEGNTRDNLETCHVSKSKHFSIAASVLEVSSSLWWPFWFSPLFYTQTSPYACSLQVRKSLLESSLTSRSIMTMTESVSKPLSAAQASDCRDAFVKAIYDKLFIWIVGKINSVIYRNLAKSPKSSPLSIGLLDIFGFENFYRNSFEQLFINFANEKLQQFFVGHIFKREQEEYRREGVAWTSVRFHDNQDVLDLLALKACNLLSLIDEESQFPKGSDSSMLRKMNQHHAENRNYVASKREGDTDFGIHHFAGAVFYDSRGFLEKNRDAVSLDLIKMVATSPSHVGDLLRLPCRPTADGSKQVPTLSGQFRQSLDSLLKALSACQPFFIRCFKPNDKKQPKVFDRNLCMHQLKCFGLMDTVHIRKLGYPIRHSLEYFLNRYRVLLDRTACDPKTSTTAACCEAICRSVIRDKDKWKIGKTKIFLKDSRDVILEQMRNQRLNRAALVIQTFMKGCKDRCSPFRTEITAFPCARAELCLSLNTRLFLFFCRMSFLRKRRAAVVLQKGWRSCKRRQKLRGYLVRKELKQKSSAAVLLQAFTRGMLARRRTEKIRDQNHELIVSDLQQRLLAIAQELEENQPITEQVSRARTPVESSDSSPVKENEITPEEEDDEFSFYRFSALHFQGGATHTHITQRLREPLLHHDDEGDALACLTVWWLILRFMEDLPEPTSPETSTKGPRLVSRNLPMRQGIRLNNTVGLEEYLERFLLQGPNSYGTYCSERLSRIKANGERTELPCWIELQAAKSKAPIDVCVALLDGRSVHLHLDSASTSAEVCQVLADKINLQDTYGFSLYISLFDKVELEHVEPFLLTLVLTRGQVLQVKWIALFFWQMCSLGSCRNHVLDAVSQCEQEMRRQGHKEEDAPWKLSFRKELFAPWHECSEDPVSTDLIYSQVIKGLKSSEYTCEKEDEYVSLAAMHHHIQFGPACNRDDVQQAVEECIPTELIESRGMTKWIHLIRSAHLQVRQRRRDAVKAELVNSARQTWALDFSRFYDVTMTSGLPLKTSLFVVAVNWRGIVFLEGKDKKLLEMPYLEIMGVRTRFLKECFSSSGECGSWSARLTTVRGEFVLKGQKAAAMAALVQEHLEGLRGRSVYALAQQDSGENENPTFLRCKRGDLLLVAGTHHWSAGGQLIRATNQRTDSSGVVFRHRLLFLPTLSRPSEDQLELLSPGQKKMVQNSVKGEETLDPVSLKDFALENFRELLRQPLLKNLMHNSELSNLACNAFTDILHLYPVILLAPSVVYHEIHHLTSFRYMGDYPVKNARPPTELTDQIFGPATQHNALKDEIYCQIMRQMTGNSYRLSVERGWQLMWLCTGLFSPSPVLLSHARRFLESRATNQLAGDCLQRLREMTSKEPRRFPPDLAELEAIQQNSTRVFHKVHFPNETNQTFEVTSTTTIRELCCSIASQLKLSSADGYGLYLKTRKKMTSLDENQYFFDGTRQASHSLKKAKKAKEANAAAHLYLVMFKRKLWLNVIPCEDPVADLTFHFPQLTELPKRTTSVQELPKYLKGRHNCTREDMIHLGGLLFRIQVGSDGSRSGAIPQMLKELIPVDQINIMSPGDWKKHLFSSYNKQGDITAKEAKIRFLKVVSTWPTFGCSFFEVKQTCEASFPNAILVVISKQGVGFMDPETKEELDLYPFSRITDYHSREEHFHMTLKTVMKGSDFVCETP
ncbi:unnamed protein product, partial [Tetraodon nigroviridis]